MNSFAAQELETIAALSHAAAADPSPHVLVLLRFLKAGHQTAYAQLRALGDNLECEPPAHSGRTLPDPSASNFLTSLRDVEDSWAATYRAAAQRHEGINQDVLVILAQHSATRAILLTAHLAVSEKGTADLQRLPLPVSSYMANGESRACMRCFVDRPGERPAITRHDPHTYVCAACHDEAEFAFPPEIRPWIDTWPEELRTSRIIEKSLSTPAKTKAQKEIHPVLAGFPSRPPPTPKSKPLPATRQFPEAIDSPAIPELQLDAASPRERAYLEVLFDPRQMQRHW